MKFVLLVLFLFIYSITIAQHHYHTIAKTPLRKTPSPKGQILIVVPKNTEVNVEKVEKNWVYGFYYGRKGYLNKNQVREDKTQ